MPAIQRTVYVDDFDGSENAAPVTFFTPDGVKRVVYLSPAHQAAFRQTLGGIERRFQKYVEVADVVSQQPKHSSSEAAKIRQWAKSQGISIPSRGRIPTAVKNKFYAAVGA